MQDGLGIAGEEQREQVPERGNSLLQEGLLRHCQLNK